MPKLITAEAEQYSIGRSAIGFAVMTKLRNYWDISLVYFPSWSPKMFLETLFLMMGNLIVSLRCNFPNNNFFFLNKTGEREEVLVKAQRY